MTPKVSTARLGVVPIQDEAPARDESVARTATPRVGAAEAAKSADYFITRDGVEFAGTHLLVEMWQARGLGDDALIRRALREAATASGATILFDHFHHFGEGHGVSGVVVLAESHISIHTWPERGFAALDLFMCGGCDPHRGIPVLRRYFAPGDMQVSEHRRGLRT
jgi:S-adenosylmethionine decarboxylase